jgi:hypothetical protein
VEEAIPKLPQQIEPLRAGFFRHEQVEVHGISDIPSRRDEREGLPSLRDPSCFWRRDPRR